MQDCAAPHPHALRLLFGGDVMLGRLVKQAIARQGAGYPLAPVHALLAAADAVVVNLECALTDVAEVWQGAPKAFYFAGPSNAAKGLAEAGVSLVSLANNHVLDFGAAGLQDTLAALERWGIAHAGAGMDVGEARTPGFITRRGFSIGMTAWCDHQADFAAGVDRPGVAYLDWERPMKEILEQVRQDARRLGDAGTDFPVLSLHWGPNWALRPEAAFIDLAHGAIDAGFRMVYGHSAHVFQGIEFYRGCPILYAAGDMVDDYYVDTAYRNDRQILFEVELSDGRVERVTCYPVVIEREQVRPARGAEMAAIGKALQARCAMVGTTLQGDGDKVWVDNPGASP